MEIQKETFYIKKKTTKNKIVCLDSEFGFLRLQSEL